MHLPPFMKISSLFISFLLIIGMFFTACSSKKRKPKLTPPVPVAQMASILIDVQVAERLSSYEDRQDSSTIRFKQNQDSLRIYYQSILSHYQLSFDQFNKALYWYKAHPDFMDSLLKQPIERLNYQVTHLGLTTDRNKLGIAPEEIDSLRDNSSDSLN